MTISLKRCQTMAYKQGLAIYKLPTTGVLRRYAVVRADDYTRGPIVRYTGLQALHTGLQTPRWNYE